MNKHQAVSFGDWSVRWVCSWHTRDELPARLQGCSHPGFEQDQPWHSAPNTELLWILLLPSPRKHWAQQHRETLLTITLLPQTKPWRSRNDASQKWCELVTQKLDQHDGDRQSETQIKSPTQINFSFIFLYTSATKHLAKVALKVAAGNYIVSKAENILYGEILNP